MLHNGLKAMLRSRHHEDYCYVATFNCMGKRLPGLQILLRRIKSPGSNRPFYSCQLSDLAFESDCFYCANQVVLMLTNLHLHEKSGGLYQSKVTSSLACTRGQVTKHSTVKWPIAQ